MKNLLQLFTVLLLLVCAPMHVVAQQQARTVTGTVADEAGEGLAGVTVQVVGTNTFAVTDAAGDFSIRVQGEDAELLFSYVGHTSQQVAVGARSEVSVVMVSDNVLEDVVVIGYGVMQKKLVTGATVQVKGDDIAKLNTTTALGALQSQTPGVQITQESGMPGSGFKVFIRGMGTINSYGPLYVIDGVAGGDINNLNPADIESIDVLKDAASAAIYGSRAANGVILVTTKQGRKGKVQVSLDGYYGWQNVYRMPDMLNAQEYMMIQNEANLEDGAPAVDWASYFPGDYLGGLYKNIMDGTWKGTNWVNESRNPNAPTQNYTFNVTGGSDVSVFSVGLGYTSQEGIFGYPRVPSWERYSARINSEYTLIKGRSFDIVKFGENLTYTYRKSSGMIQNAASMYSSDLYSLMRFDPLTPVYDANGDWFGNSVANPQIANPLAMTKNRNSDNLSQNHILRTSAYLTVQPIKNLIFKSTFGYNYSMGTGRSYAPTWELGSQSNLVESVSQSMGGGYAWNWENTLTYQFDIAKDHHFTALLGQSLEKWGMGQELSVTNGNPRFHDFEHAYIRNTTNGPNSQPQEDPAMRIDGTPWGQGRLASFFGRVSYDYKNKYMATVVLRADGSSNFARGHRWGYFPSVSAGWVVTEEPWMQGVTHVMDFLKIRASWGQNGNSNIPNFQYLGTIASGAGYTFGGNKGIIAPGAFADILPNPNVSWETSEQIDLGFDASFFRSRLSVAFDYYIKNTKDWLVPAPQLSSYGTGAPYINGGDIRNSGVELALGWNDRVGEFTYGANVNFSYNKNEVTRIANDQGVIQGNPASILFELGEVEFYRVQVGRPVGFFYGYQTNGVFQSWKQINDYNAVHNNIQVNAKPGDVIWLDRDGNNVIDDNDKGMIGNPYPDFNLGINLNFGWKGFDLNLTMNGVFGNQVIRSWRNWGIYTDNYTSEILGRWHGEGTSNRLPRVTRNDPNGNYKRISDLFIENGDYVKMQNITLGYDFKYLLPKANFLSQLRLYVAVQNAFTITGYSGMDPELGQAGPGDGFGWSSGIDVGYYPTPRTWMVGANLKF